jgi:hypothetical protein
MYQYFPPIGGERDTTERARLHFATNVASLPRPDLAYRYMKNINNQYQLIRPQNVSNQFIVFGHTTSQEIF